MAKRAEMSGVRFFAEYTTADKRKLAGTVIVCIVPRNGDERNGTCVKSVACSSPTAAPSVTWTSAAYLARRCSEVTEEQARAIHPALFRALAAFEGATPAERARIIAQRRSPLQAWIPTSAIGVSRTSPV